MSAPVSTTLVSDDTRAALGELVELRLRSMKVRVSPPMVTVSTAHAGHVLLEAFRAPPESLYMAVSVRAHVPDIDAGLRAEIARRAMDLATDVHTAKLRDPDILAARDGARALAERLRVDDGDAAARA